MSNYRRLYTRGATYFFTVVSEQRRPILCEPDIRLALREAIEWVRRDRPFHIDGWVLLPDHLHALWTLPEGDADFVTRWQSIKRRVSAQCKMLFVDAKQLNASQRKHREAGLWQRRYWEHQIRDDKDFAQHVDYLHINPLKHGLVNQVADWPYSSFHRYVKAGVYPADWGGSAQIAAYADMRE